MTLTRRSPLRAQPRSKGNRFERDVIDLLRAHGWSGARRNWQSGGQGGGDIIEGPGDVHVECKHVERLAVWEWIAQAEAGARPTDIPVVVFRRNRAKTWAILPLDEWEALRRLRPSLKTCTVSRLRSRTDLWGWIAFAVADAVEAGPEFVPTVDFARPGSGWYAAVPADVLFMLLRQRETA